VKPLAAVPVLGVDPGTRTVGFAVVRSGARPALRAFGAIRLRAEEPLAVRLGRIHRGLAEVIARHRPAVLAVEEVFHGKNFQSALKVGQARGVALLAGAQHGIAVAEYAPNLVKKTIVGSGHGDKTQIRMMVGVLLPKADPSSEDAADALAIAICHAHHRTSAVLKAVAS